MFSEETMIVAPPSLTPGSGPPVHSLSLVLPTLDVLFKWHRVVAGLLSPAAFTWHVFGVHPGVAFIRLCFFLLPDYIPLRGMAHFVHPLMDVCVVSTL